jgi:hypothetical protein
MVDITGEISKPTSVYWQVEANGAAPTHEALNNWYFKTFMKSQTRYKIALIIQIA